MSSAPPFHVIVSDMDGTLLSPDSAVSARTRATLQRVLETYPHEVCVVLASGRHTRDLAAYLQNLELPEWSGYLVSCNGACAHSVITGNNEPGTSQRLLESVMGESLNPDAVQALLSYFDPEEEEININLYKNDEWWCIQDWRDELKHNTLSGSRYKLFNPVELSQAYEAYKASGPSHRQGSGSNPLAEVWKVYIGTDNIQRLQALHSRICSDHPTLTVSFSSKYCMEITAEGVTKTSGIAALLPIMQQRCRDAAVAARCAKGTVTAAGVADEEPWALKDCIAFGDGENDAHMLLSVGKGCLMNNAPDALKARLSSIEVVPSNREDGVAVKLCEVFELK